MSPRLWKGTEAEDEPFVPEAVHEHAIHTPVSLIRSLTWNRGLEVAKHKSFTVATKVNVYFCGPNSPWQRGTGADASSIQL